MNTKQIHLYRLKLVQGELLKFLWKFVYTLQNIIFLPLVLAVALFSCIFESANLFAMMVEYLEVLSNGYKTINMEVDKYSEEANTLETVGFTIVAAGLTYIIVSLSGTICGIIAKSSFM